MYSWNMYVYSTQKMNWKRLVLIYIEILNKEVMVKDTHIFLRCRDVNHATREDAGGLSREYVLRIPSVS